MPDSKESFADWLDPQKCADILREERWIDGIVKCPFCQSENVFVLCKYQEIFFRYQCRDCTKRDDKKTTFNDKTGTMYEDSKVSITKWFYAKALLRNKISDLQLSEELQVDYNTARRMSLLIKGNIFLPGRR